VVARIGAHVVADTTRALTLHEWGYPPVQYIPLDDVDQTLLASSDTQTYCPYKGDGSYYSIRLPDGQDAEGRLADAVWSYLAPYDSVAPIANHVAFYTDRVEVVVGRPHRNADNSREARHRPAAGSPAVAPWGEGRFVSVIDDARLDVEEWDHHRRAGHRGRR
jgi:uncharacterized protein (DUF427 family)